MDQDCDIRGVCPFKGSGKFTSCQRARGFLNFFAGHVTSNVVDVSQPRSSQCQKLSLKAKQKQRLRSWQFCRDEIPANPDQSSRSRWGQAPFRKPGNEVGVRKSWKSVGWVSRNFKFTKGKGKFWNLLCNLLFQESRGCESISHSLQNRELSNREIGISCPTMIWGRTWVVGDKLMLFSDRIWV